LVFLYGVIDEGFVVDGDGYTSCNGDCNDTNSAIKLGAQETCNGNDDTCNTQIDDGCCSLKATDSVTNVKCLNGTNGKITLNVGGAIVPYTAQWSNGSTGLSISGVLNGPANDLCGGGIFNYNIAAPIDATSYNWSLPTGCSIVTNSGNSVSINVPNNFVAGNICVTASNACGASAAKCLALSNKPATPVSITGPSSVCSGQVGVAFSTPAVGTNTFTWTVPTSTTLVSGQGTTDISVNWGTTAGTVFVKANNACGSSTNRSKTVSIAACMAEADNSEDEEFRAFDFAPSLVVYPNPNTGQFIMRSDVKGTYQLINSLGQMIQTFQLNADNNYQVEVSGLSTGFYMIIGNNEFGEVSEKVVVTNR
jgi:hypothetical protein